MRVATPYSHNFLKEREYKIKQNLTWRELLAFQFPLQSFAPKISNKCVCWETENYAALLTVTPESINTGCPDFLGTKSHKTFENIQKPKHSRGTLLALNFIIVFCTILRFKGIK